MCESGRMLDRYMLVLRLVKRLDAVRCSPTFSPTSALSKRRFIQRSLAAPLQRCSGRNRPRLGLVACLVRRTNSLLVSTNANQKASASSRAERSLTERAASALAASRAASLSAAARSAAAAAAAAASSAACARDVAASRA